MPQSPNSLFRLARRTHRLRSFLAMEVLEKSQEMARLGKDVISLSVGEPDFPAPVPVKSAAVKAIRQDFTKYTHSLGMPELREAVCAHYRKRYRVGLHPDQVLVTPGTSPAMLLLFGALFNPGDEAILSDPHYPCYSNFLRFFEAIPNLVKVREEEAFQYRPEAVRKKICRRTKAILLNSPSNPTGCTVSSAVMKELAATGKYIVSDEIYHGLTYQGEERSILEFTDRAFVLNGFSKAYAMTGFRLGYCIFPKSFSKVMQTLAQNFLISTSGFIQKAGIAALMEGEAQQSRMRKIFNRRRKLMLEEVKKMGFHVAVEPTGAFYVFANAKHYTRDSHRFAFDLLQKAKVGITPGVDFGPSGEGFLRFSYATEESKIREGLARIEAYLRQRKLL